MFVNLSSVVPASTLSEVLLLGPKTSWDRDILVALDDLNNILKVYQSLTIRKGSFSR